MNLKQTASLVVLLLSMPTLCMADTSSIATDLRTDNRVNPIGIDRQPVMLSWRMEAGGRQGAAQKAYQVVAVTQKTGQQTGAVLWDSGKVAESRSHQIAYGGPALQPGQRIYWRVKIWDENDRQSEWSKPAWFEAGLLEDQNWDDAQWIGDTRDHRAPEPAPAELMGPWIGTADGKTFDSLEVNFDLPSKPIVTAQLHQYFPQGKNLPRTVWVNKDNAAGLPRGRSYEGFRKRFGSRSIGPMDIATDLVPGQNNRIEIEIRRPANAMTIGMQIVFADGTEQLVQSGDQWKVSSGGKDAVMATVLDAYDGSKFGTTISHHQSSHGPVWMRKGLTVKDDLVRARLYLCALGQGLTYINGELVDDVFFSSPQSDYEEFAYYTAHDITSMLTPGDNALSVLLDSGWYHQVGGFSTAFSYGHPGLIAKVSLEYGDGSTQTVLSDDSWQWRESEIVLSNIYRGERLDYRLQHDSWKSVDEQEGWKDVQTLPPRSPKLVAMDVNPVKRNEQLPVVQQWQTGEKTWLFDFGQTIHGTVRLKFNEPADSVVRLRYTEYAEDGVLENVPLSHWICHGVMQYDELICDGKPRVYESIFNPKSFRFVEVSGLSQPPPAGELVAYTVHTQADTLAAFESSDSMLNRLFENGVRTFQNYVNHMSGDMPRERCLWGLESIYSFDTAVCTFDWQNNHRLMNTLWWTGRKTKENLPGHIGVGLRISTYTNSFNWSATPLLLTSRILEFFEDAEPTRLYYQQAKDFLSFYENNCDENYYPVHQQLADHAAPFGVPRSPRNAGIIARMTFFDSQRRFAAMADAMEKPDDAAHARDYADKIHAAIMRDYDAKNHTFGNATYDSLALSYKIITDPKECQAVASSIADAYRKNGHKYDGGFMSYEVYPMLAKYGYVEDAYKMLVNTDYPGPAWSVEQYDATTYYELYSVDREIQMKVGQNFWAFGHPTGWMIKSLAGLGYDPDQPMGRGMILSPKVPRSGKLDHVAASLQTPAGIAKSHWTYDDGVFDWSFTVPANAVAEVHIPADDVASIRGVDEMKKLRDEDNTSVYEAVAGTYSIQSKLMERQPDAGGPPIPSGGVNEWIVSKGCEKGVSEGAMTVTAGPTATQTLTARLPDFKSGDNRVSFRMKTPATGKAQVLLKSGTRGKRLTTKVEFELGEPDQWKDYSIEIPKFEGKPFSLWIGLTTAKAPLSLTDIELQSGGKAVKRWEF
ncbi:Bacterial alpha-L-rhamnosidase [Rubripirellula obstinata]|uniref:alpha-L-rhamnosidase n=1 Tax=Rubripirellula obstinata TaxID=406547 RepID=A0A5B1CI60_9BACT|nr:family 78 glycoside hydrolase catalytic domain [Rubripirellula obstinata]KAA1259921.1 Bacterial alpha-L-rhamnosidase [Rubripirellula obstinata]